MIKKITSATLAAAITLGIAGVVHTSELYAAKPAEPGKSETKNDDQSSEKNQVSYWEAQYPGSTCTKTSGSGTEYEVKALPSGTVYAAIIVKAGSESSVGDPNKVYTDVTVGQKLTAPDGKNISHVIVCTKPAGGSGGGTTTTTQTTTPVVGGSGTAAPAPTASGRGSAVTSLPVTSGSDSQITALALMVGSVLAGSAAYAVRSRSDFSL